MKFVQLTDTEYAKAFTGFDRANLMQSLERKSLRDKMGYQTFLVGVKDGEKIIAAGLIVGHNYEAWLQHGPLLDWKNNDATSVFLDGLIHFCKKAGFYKIEVYPPVVLSIRNSDGNIIESMHIGKLNKIFEEAGFSHMGYTTQMDFKALRWMFVKNLEGVNSEREIELSFNSSTRKKLHQTQRNLYIYVLKEKSELKEWITPLNESNARNHIKSRDLQYFEDLWDCFGDKATFVEARNKTTNELVSSELDIWYEYESVAFLAGTINAMRKYNGITAIKGWQLNECLKRKQARVNFYGVDGVFSNDNLLLKSKSGFGGNVEEYIGGFSYYIDREKYIISKIKRKLRLR